MENMENMVQVLVVDDEPAVALAIKSALKFCGYSVTTAPSGDAALELIEANPSQFSVLLSDHNMPGLGGPALVRAARSAGFPGKIVILSAFLTDTNVALYEQLGVDQILSKPFSLERLRIALQNALHLVSCE
jgi:two-component system response regulator EvgA